MFRNLNLKSPAGAHSLHRFVRPLNELIGVWRKRAGRKFKDAETEKNAMGKRLIEHGAMCYFNCSRDLEKIVVSLLALTTPPKSKPSKKHQA